MTLSNKMFQPSRILYEVVSGTFRANGTTFEVWCKENSIIPNRARDALMGTNIGVSGKELLGKLVDGAGSAVVTAAYSQRMENHVAELKAHGVAA